MKYFKTILWLVFTVKCAFGQEPSRERVVTKTTIEVTAKPTEELKAKQQARTQLALYKDQFRSLMGLRGISKDEEYYKAFEKIAENVNDYTRVFEFIRRYYAVNSATAIIYYFFNNDSLTRVFFDPALNEPKIDAFHIKKSELVNLPVSLNQAIINYKIKADISRGVTLINKQPQDLDSLIKTATHLFIPAEFNEGYKNLIIIPALNIGTVPFHVLRPYGDNRYLIDNCSFTISPGLIDFIGMSDKLYRNNGLETKLGIRTAKWKFDNPIFICDPVYPKNKGMIFGDLPGAKAEIDSVKQYASKYILLSGPEATKENVLKNIKDTDLAYFATHGIADDTDPMQKSFLVLSGEEDPFLTAKDIIDLRIRSADSIGVVHNFPEMVILSACQTGLGRTVDAGIIGLARSFMVAGSRHVIMSLWNVDDAATAYLMSRFMWHLTRPAKYIPADPLRMAMLDTRIKYPEPSKWASFSMFGISY